MTNRTTIMAWSGLVAAAVAVAGVAGPARAAVLVYEGFNGYTGNLSGKTPNANTIGLKQNVNYAGSNPGGITASATGLSLSNLYVTGGSGTFSTATVVATAQINRATPYQGTLWNSYLVRLTSRGNVAANGMEVRLGDNDATDNNRFRVQADSRNSTSNQIANAYNSDMVDGGGALTLSTTYIMISRFTNVGTTLSATTQGQGTSWALTAAQFDALKADPNPEAYLLAATVAGGQVTARAADVALTSGTFGFADGNRVQIVSVNDAGTLDEVRYGPTLADVTPVPEPAALGLVGLATASLALRRRRQQAR